MENLKIQIRRKFIALVILCFTGCNTVQLNPDPFSKTILNEKNQQNVIYKKIRITSRLNNDPNGVLSRNMSNSRSVFLEHELIKRLKKTGNFSVVRSAPTTVDVISDPTGSTDDIEIEIVINEQYTYNDPASIYVLRFISFGFYPQTVRKHFIINIQSHDNLNHKVSVLTKEYDAEFKFSTPMNLIPWNLELHPFTAGFQIETDAKMVLPFLIEILTSKPKLVLK